MSDARDSQTNLAPAGGVAAGSSSTEKGADEGSRRQFNYPLVKVCEMDAELKAEVVDMVVTAVEKHINNYEAGAKLIKEQMDKRCGASWHVVVGEGFGFDATHEAKNLMLLYFGGYIGVLLWKSS